MALFHFNLPLLLFSESIPPAQCCAAIPSRSLASTAFLCPSVDLFHEVYAKDALNAGNPTHNGPHRKNCMDHVSIRCSWLFLSDLSSTLRTFMPFFPPTPTKL